MYDRMSIQEGMTVRSADGHKLGKVFAIGETEFQVEKGIFFPKDYLARYGDIADIRGHDIILRHGREDLRGAEAGRVEHGIEERGVVPEAGTPSSADVGTGLGTARYGERTPAMREAGQPPMHAAVASEGHTEQVPVRPAPVTVVREERRVGGTPEEEERTRRLGVPEDETKTRY